MESKLVSGFNKYRNNVNEKLMATLYKVLKRIFGVETLVYMSGALNSKVKELLGLVAPMVFKCNGCIFYHPEFFYNWNVTNKEPMKTFDITDLTGSTIINPTST